MRVNRAGTARSEELLKLLHEGAGNVPVMIVDTQKPPVLVMSYWLSRHYLSEGISLGLDDD